MDVHLIKYDPNFYEYDAQTLPRIVDLFVKTGGDVNATYTCDLATWEQPPLYFAVLQNSVESVRLLLEAGADPNWMAAADFTPLHITCRQTPGQDTLDIATLLLDYGADPLAEDGGGRCPLHYAFHERNSQLVDMLLARLPKGANPTDSQNLSAFHIACAHGADSVVRDMLDSGVQVDQHTRSTWHRVRLNGLHYAIMDNRKSTVELLLQRGVDVKSEDVSLKMLLHLACECNVEKFAEPFNGHYIEMSKDMAASQQDHLGIVNLLLDHGVDVNETNDDGLTPLLYSCTYRVTSAVAWRISSSFADDSTTKSIDDHQITRRRLIVQCLLERGAAISARGPNGKGLLHLQIESNFVRNCAHDAETFDLFAKYGVDVNARDERGLTPLHAVFDYALYLNNPAFGSTVTGIMNSLLKHGADVNARAADGVTPVTLLLRNLYYVDEEQLSRSDFMRILMVHAQLLAMIGLAVDEVTRECLTEMAAFGAYELDTVEKECADELADMKRVCVDETSLYRLLRTGLDATGQGLPESKQRAIAKDAKISEKYPHYAYLFELQVTRGRVLKRAESAIRLIARCELPYLCTEVIIKYLSDFDLRNLADIRVCKKKAD